MSFIQSCGERGKKSARGRRRSRDEKGNQGVRDFRFINILQLFSIYFFFELLYFITFFSRLFFYPRNLPTPTPGPTPNPHPRPTTHDIQLHSVGEKTPTVSDSLPAYLVCLVWPGLVLKLPLIHRLWSVEFLQRRAFEKVDFLKALFRFLMVGWSLCDRCQSFQSWIFGVELGALDCSQLS